MAKSGGPIHFGIADGIGDPLDVTRALRADLTQTLDGLYKSMAHRWIEAWDQIAGELEWALVRDAAELAQHGRVSGAALARSQRLQAALDGMGQSLEGIARANAQEMSGRVSEAIRLATEGAYTTIRSQLPSNYVPAIQAALTRASPKQIEAIVARSTERFWSLNLPLSDRGAAAARRELVRGMAVGSNPRLAARRMLEGIEGAFNGGLTRAMTIARTEMMDATRDAARVVEMENSDVLDHWVWLATLEGRTCGACLGMHGMKFPTSQPGPEGHPNCRCARQPVTKDWEELGFDVEGLRPEHPQPGDGELWLKGQSEAVQRQALGTKARWEAWQAGNYPWGNWAVLNMNGAAWRNSYGPGKIPAALRPEGESRFSDLANMPESRFFDQADLPPWAWSMEDNYQFADDAALARKAYAKQGPREKQIADFVPDWTSGRPSIMRKQLEAGEWPHVWDIVNQHPVKAPDALLRGQGANNVADAQWMRGLKEGDAIDLGGATGFSSDWRVTRQFMDGDVNIAITLNDAYGLPVGQISTHPSEMEWFVGGHVRIDSIIDVTQRDTLEAITPGATASLPPDWTGTLERRITGTWIPKVEGWTPSR